MDHPKAGWGRLLWTDQVWVSARMCQKLQVWESWVAVQLSAIVVPTASKPQQDGPAVSLFPTQ